MKRIGLFTIFLTIVTTIYTGMNYYVYQNLTTGFSIVEGGRLFLQMVFILLGGTFIVSRFLQKRYPIYRITYIGNTWFGVISIALSVFLFQDLVLLVIGRDYRNVIFPVAIITIIGLILWGFYNVYRGTVIKEVKISTPKVEKGKEFSIALLSDVHLGMMTTPHWVKSIVQQVNSLEADLIVITGDLVDDEYRYINRFIPVLKEFKSRLGVYAVAGNHDHFRGTEEFKEFLQKSNINLLMNRAVKITPDLMLLGVDDGLGKTNRPLFEEVLSQCQKSTYNVILSHQPIFFQEAVEKGVDLQLSGHTHRGQIFPLNLMISLFYKYSYGLYQYKTGHIYTTSGTGVWGPPMRHLSDCEVVHLKIHNK